jgi:hypothetical protein
MSSTEDFGETSLRDGWSDSDAFSFGSLRKKMFIINNDKTTTPQIITISYRQQRHQHTFTQSIDKSLCHTRISQRWKMQHIRV